MKLQAQYNRVTVAATLAILLIAAIGYYYLIRYVLIGELDEALKVEEIEIMDHIKKYNRLPEPTVYKDQRIAFEKAPSISDRHFQSLLAFNPEENQMESSRQLIFTVEVGGQQYRALVTKSEEATHDLVWIILFSTVALLVLLAVILFITNRFLFKKLWKPFRNTLSTIKKFDLSAPVDLTMQPTNITEFKELNNSIRLMAQKVLKDYQSLKDFTDHASHEIQTPLAIINSKLDLLIQEPELSEKSMDQVQSIYAAVEKLARLSRSLLLLTRIDSNQFVEMEQVSFDEIIEEKVEEMQEWIRSANVTVTVEPGNLRVTMNKELAEMLVSNLFSNAVRHSSSNESIFIRTSPYCFSIANRGTAPLDKNKVFDKFYKSDNSRGTGLGLAIVRQICDQYKFHVSYEFLDQQHFFKIDFNERSK
ncbi:MAG TPA: HAMP domain-containing sensor histidine kinase [Chitinophagaceae bacterium]|nr:HAMP domain-containing sensor histidine kinase [Chitinophagaceae bacterium]